MKLNLYHKTKKYTYYSLPFNVRYNNFDYFLRVDHATNKSCIISEHALYSKRKHVLKSFATEKQALDFIASCKTDNGIEQNPNQDLQGLIRMIDAM